jgi:hypothetical protein
VRLLLWFSFPLELLKICENMLPQVILLLEEILG